MKRLSKTVILGLTMTLALSATADAQEMRKGASTLSGKVVSYSVVAPIGVDTPLVTGPAVADGFLVLTKVCGTTVTSSSSGPMLPSGVLIDVGDCYDNPTGLPLAAGQVITCKSSPSFATHCLATGILSRR